MIADLAFRSNPYVGPRTFSAEESQLFFGREREARNLHDLLVISNLVLFYAQSGAGKSSLINARVIPSLREENGYEILPIGRVGGEFPANAGQVANIFVYNLIQSLAQDASDPERFATMSLADFLLDELTPGNAAQELQAVDVPHRLLVIDQFEEIITAHPDRWAERPEFFRHLGRAIREDPYLHVLLIMREEYIAPLDLFAPLVPDRLRTRFYMQRMGVDVALEAIRRPAELAGHPFAPGVAEMLVDNLSLIRITGQESAVVGQFIEPVQLQVVCYQLWEGLGKSVERAGQPITDADLAQRGDVNQALTQFYEETLRAILADPFVAGVSERQLRAWFDTELITEAGTRGLVLQGEQSTGGLPNSVVQMLQARFLVRAEARSGSVWVELAHDRFVEPIRASTAAWFAQNTSILQRQAALWDQQGRPDGLLLRENVLADAEAWAAAHQQELLPNEHEFLNRSRESFLRTERERQKNQRVRLLAIVAVVVAIISVMATVVAVWVLMMTR